MFEGTEITESIYEGVIEPPTRADTNFDSLRSKIRGEFA